MNRIAIFAVGGALTLPGCLATATDVAQCRADILQAVKDAQDNFSKQNLLVTQHDVAGLQQQITEGDRKAQDAVDKANAQAAEAARAQAEIANLGKVALNVADLASDGRIGKVVDSVRDFAGQVDQKSKDRSTTDTWTALLSALGAAGVGGLAGKTGKSRSQPEIDELFAKTEKLGKALVSKNPDVASLIGPSPQT